MKNKFEFKDIDDISGTALIAWIISSIIALIFLIATKNTLAISAIINKNPIMLFIAMVLSLGIGATIWKIYHKTNFDIQNIQIEQIGSPITIHKDKYSKQYRVEIGNNYSFWLQPHQLEIIDSEKPISGTIELRYRIENFGPFFSVEKRYSAKTQTIHINTEFAKAQMLSKKKNPYLLK